MKKLTQILKEVLSFALGFALGWFFPFTSICGLITYSIYTTVVRKIAFKKAMEDIEVYFNTTREPQFVVTS